MGRVALLGWCAGAFKVGARDAWIGWAREQQFRRLRLVANNCRFLVLPRGRVPNLASRALALSARRLSADMEARFGHPVLLAETFVDPSRFRGVCYRAAGWEEVGATRGHARSGGGWVARGEPKTVWLRPLAPDAAAALAGLAEPADWGCARTEPELPAPGRLRSLFDHLRGVPEFRRARGARHSLATVLAIAAAAKLAGAQGPTAIAEFGARLDQRQLAAARAFRSLATGRLAPPSRASMHRLLSGIDPDALDRAVRRFSAGRLIRELDVAGRVLTLDALRSCPKTARLILGEGADCVLPVKGNRKTPREDITAFDAAFDAAPAAETRDKGHGRLEERSCQLVPLDAHPDDPAALPGRRQAFRIRRRRTILKKNATTEETVCGPTSLGPDRAGPAEILALNRGRWEIENRLHHPRDWSWDEDRSRVRSGKLPRNLACLTNAAISIVRLRGRFQHQPQAQRHYAARQGEALREVLHAA